MNSRSSGPFLLRKELWLAAAALALLLCLFGMALPARADVLVAGNVKTLLKSNVSRAYVLAELKNCSAAPTFRARC